MGKNKRKLMPLSVGAIPEPKKEKKAQKSYPASSDPFLISSASEIERMAAYNKPMVVLQPEEFELIGIREPDGSVRPLKKNPPKVKQTNAKTKKSKNDRKTIMINSTA
ncbi:MAG: hypothetical protein K2F99_03425, partial [Muribaculaceae bacterium]|nr:hypothetical protein [Muribaculaceae bacterium]